MSAKRNRNATAMTRFFEQRDMLALLVTAPAGIEGGAASGHPHRRIRRLVADLNGGNADRVPAYEIKAIFSGLAEECRGDRRPSTFGDEPSGRCEPSHQRPGKRARRVTNGNNLHSLLRFVERVVHGRYDKSPGCKKDDDDVEFLEKELIGYFGTKDSSFQAEEEIMCLAFEMATHAIMSTDDAADSRDRGSCIVKTALHIIDSVIRIDKRERAARFRLQQAKKNAIRANVANRRTKYELLLCPNNERRGNGGNEVPSETAPETKSIIEERYPRQWEWLHRFRVNEVPTLEGNDELQRSHYPHPDLYSEENVESAGLDETLQDAQAPLDAKREQPPGSNSFVIVRRRIETLDDISLSSHESDLDMNEEKDADTSDGKKSEHIPSDGTAEKSGVDDTAANATSSQPESSTAQESPTSDQTVSPYDKLDKEAHELRLSLLDMPPSESTSMEVVRHTVDEITNLLSRYGELDGAAGITRCGDVIGGIRTVSTQDGTAEASSERATTARHPLNDTLVSSLVKECLTDATGALRAKAFLRSFVLPLMVEMNPVARAASMGPNVDAQSVAEEKGKPASRILTSLLATLARDRPTECIVSVVVPSLVLRKQKPTIPLETEALFQPTRFQCELISRLLKGKDAVSAPAVSVLVEQLLPPNEGTNNDSPTRGGMVWTDHTMPVLTACLNRQPTLSDEVVGKLAYEMARHLSPKSPQSMVKNMKFSTLFHALISKYGPQVKSVGKVESLKESATRLKTFMSKTIGLALKKLS